jgi:hypothetical protein
MARTGRGRLTIAGLLLVLIAGGADPHNSASRDKRALAPVQAFVGGWRGVGQPKRGSNQGAWTEESQWSWRFEQGRAELVAQILPHKYYAQFRLQAGEKPGQFALLALPVENGQPDHQTPPRRFVGALLDDTLVLTADDPADDRPARISLRLVAGGDRMLLLYEKRVAAGTFVRLAEVGSTRQGSSFAKAAASGPECVITGGLGTIAVTHKGQKYFVCCTGCRELFLDDPEKALAEYRQRKAAEKAEKNQ